MAALDDVTQGDFDALVLGADLPVLVDFWGEHCPPCRAISPILRDLAAEYENRVRIVKVASDENPELAARYRVMTLPTVLAFAAGTVVGQITGARSRAAFVDLAERALAASS